MASRQSECQQKKKIKKEYIPVPYPVKEYIPVPMKKEMMPMEHGKMQMGGMHEMHGMDTKQSVTYMKADNYERRDNQRGESSEKQLQWNPKRVRKVIKYE